MEDSIFKKLYKQLNPAQKEAVDIVEGPVMVVAGPGTGKTQILTLRIANILKETQVEPENILALTFTEHAASSMRRRLAEIIGSQAYRVRISTFHGFCNEIIKSYPEEFPHIIGAINITKPEQIQIIEQLIEMLPLKELKPFGDPLYYLQSLISSIEQLKREGIDPERYLKLVEDEKKYFDLIDDLYHDKGAHKGKMKGDYQKLFKTIVKNQEAAIVYDAYQKKLRKKKLYDYSDMIMEVMQALSVNGDLLLNLQEQYQYFLVDEHQDTNNAQNKILELLCNFHPSPNLFVVGDEKQAIFRFQGASLENFTYFKKLYRDAKLVILDNNYRSTQAILNVAENIIPGQKKLQADTKQLGRKIKLHEFSNVQSENYFLARDIQSKIAEGVVPGSIAILYRDNRDALPIAWVLEKFSTPFSIESDQNILNDKQIRKLIMLIELTNDIGSEKKIVDALHIDFLKVAPLDIYKLSDYARKNKVMIQDAMRSGKILASLGLESADIIEELYKKLSGWAILAKNDNITEFFEKLINESGFLGYILASKSVEALEKVNLFYDELKVFVERHKDADLEKFCQYLHLLKEHNVLIKRVMVGNKEAVHLMTAHKSKGLEFDYVYIVNAYDGHWGNKRKFEPIQLISSVFSISHSHLQHDQNDDERRVFYVALTRAKKEVAITYSATGIDGREQIVSQFVSEIDPVLIDSVNISGYEKDLKKDLSTIFASSKNSGVDIKSKDFIRQLFMDRGLSVTALNNYLKCPWNYFYNNLLRIPRAKSASQMYGTAVHAALKDFFEKLRTKSVGKDFLLEKFNFYAGKESFGSNEMGGILEKGHKALGGYCENYQNSWHKNNLLEFSIRGVELSPEIRLTGAIDKIEVLNPSNEVIVVDYKTSKPKSRSEIEGMTKYSNGDIKRQLIFYNLLLNNFADGKYKMVSGDIDFVEPDDRGNYKKERFEITKSEVSDLEELIRRTGNEILNLSFWDQECDDAKCEFCDLREMMA